jgi:transposase-like protein
MTEKVLHRCHLSAALAVAQEAYIQGISTRSVDALVKALGMDGISKSQVLRLCGDIDERVNAFLTRPIEGDWPYVWLDATYMKVRRDHQIVSVAVIIAVGVNTDARRKLLGMTTGHIEAEPFWVEFLRSLARGGLRGTKLVISDAHEGLKAAISKILFATCHLAAVPRALHAQRFGLRGQDAAPHRLRMDWHCLRLAACRLHVLPEALWRKVFLVMPPSGG